MQKTENLFDYSIVVVDNDRAGSAKQMVESYARQSKISISYFLQPEQNIALARNKAIENSIGDFLGFIDDDELPSETWLLELYNTITKYNVDGVLGPVLPRYEEAPPQWVTKGHFFDRPFCKNGYVLKWENTRTGNVLFKRNLFNEDSIWFDANYGSGGEDKEFFRRKMRSGHIFYSCNEAPVFETIPSVRWGRTFMLRRALLRGKVSHKNSAEKSLDICKSLLAIGIYTLGLPFYLILGHHIFMTYLVKNCDHLGKVLTAMRIKVIKEKYVTN
jgi:glycosyltransferase involved in cell wall biosynthesis